MLTDELIKATVPLEAEGADDIEEIEQDVDDSDEDEER